MGLKDFLKKQGFIEEDQADKTKAQAGSTKPVMQQSTDTAPIFSSLLSGNNSSAGSSDPSFVVSSFEQSTNEKEQLDPSFVKFFEDELAKANLAGPDYFEFRQQLLKTQQKMASKGMAAPEVVLQAVLMSFEAQDIHPAKLIEAARHYKDIVKQKNEDFLKGAATEKNNQLQKRQSVLQSHNDNINKIQQQLQQLELQKQQLTDTMNKEKTQAEVDKSLGKEAIEKIEKAERLIAAAHNYIQSSIDGDIARLQSV